MGFTLPWMDRLKSLTTGMPQGMAVSCAVYREHLARQVILDGQLESLDLSFICEQEPFDPSLLEILKPMVALKKLSLTLDVVGANFQSFNTALAQGRARGLLPRLQVLRLTGEEYAYGQTNIPLLDLVDLFSKIVGPHLKKLILCLHSDAYINNADHFHINLTRFTALKTVIIKHEKVGEFVKPSAQVSAPFILKGHLISSTVTSLTIRDMLTFDESYLNAIGSSFPNLTELNLSIFEASPGLYHFSGDPVAILNQFLPKLTVARFHGGRMTETFERLMIYLAGRAKAERQKILLQTELLASGMGHFIEQYCKDNDWFQCQ